MSSIAVNGAAARTAFLYDSLVGKKIIMAVTGVVLFGFVCVHMLANLQAFLPKGPDGYALDHYAQHLRALPPLLWGTRIVLLVAVVLHMLMALQLWLLKRRARPLSYLKKANIASTYASRTMYVSGPLVLLYVVYHLLHFTFGAVHTADFQEGAVQHNVVVGFSNPLISFVYIAANILLATHLYHGVWSMLQTLGIAHPVYTPRLKLAAKLFAIAIGIGFCSVPIGVLTGLIPPVE